MLSRFTNSHTHSLTQSLTQSLCHNLVRTFDQLAIVRSAWKFYGMFLRWIPLDNFFVSSNFHSELFLRHFGKTMESHKKIAKIFIFQHKATKFEQNVIFCKKTWSPKKNFKNFETLRRYGWLTEKNSNFQFYPILMKLKTNDVFAILKQSINKF